MCVPYTFFHAYHLLSAIRLWFDNFMDYGQIPGPLYGFAILVLFVRKQVQSFSSFNIYYLILTKKEINDAAHTQIFVNQCLAKV